MAKPRFYPKTSKVRATAPSITRQKLLGGRPSIRRIGKLFQKMSSCAWKIQASKPWKRPLAYPPINGERTNLLWLRKNALNAFTSTIAPYDSAIDGSYSDLQEAINKITVKPSRDQGLSLSHTRGELLIDGILFKKQKLTILTPDESDTLMQQVVFDQLINDSTSLTISLMYNNQKDKETLYSIIQSSE